MNDCGLNRWNAVKSMIESYCWNLAVVTLLALNFSKYHGSESTVLPKPFNYTEFMINHLRSEKSFSKKITDHNIDPIDKSTQTSADDRIFFKPYHFPFWGLPYGISSGGGFFNPGLFPFVPGGPGFPPFDGIFGGPLGPGKFPGGGPTPFQGPGNSSMNGNDSQNSKNESESQGKMRYPRTPGYRKKRRRKKPPKKICCYPITTAAPEEYEEPHYYPEPYPEEHEETPGYYDDINYSTIERPNYSNYMMANEPSEQPRRPNYMTTESSDQPRYQKYKPIEPLGAPSYPKYKPADSPKIPNYARPTAAKVKYPNSYRSPTSSSYGNQPNKGPQTYNVPMMPVKSNYQKPPMERPNKYQVHQPGYRMRKPPLDSQKRPYSDLQRYRSRPRKPEIYSVSESPSYSSEDTYEEESTGPTITYSDNHHIGYSSMKSGSQRTSKKYTTSTTTSSTNYDYDTYVPITESPAGFTTSPHIYNTGNVSLVVNLTPCQFYALTKLLAPECSIETSTYTQNTRSYPTTHPPQEKHPITRNYGSSVSSDSNTTITISLPSEYFFSHLFPVHKESSQKFQTSNSVVTMRPIYNPTPTQYDIPYPGSPVFQYTYVSQPLPPSKQASNEPVHIAPYHYVITPPKTTHSIPPQYMEPAAHFGHSAIWPYPSYKLHYNLPPSDYAQPPTQYSAFSFTTPTPQPFHDKPLLQKMYISPIEGIHVPKPIPAPPPRHPIYFIPPPQPIYFTPPPQHMDATPSSQPDYDTPSPQFMYGIPAPHPTPEHMYITPPPKYMYITPPPKPNYGTPLPEFIHVTPPSQPTYVATPPQSMYVTPPPPSMYATQLSQPVFAQPHPQVMHATPFQHMYDSPLQDIYSTPSPSTNYFTAQSTYSTPKQEQLTSFNLINNVQHSPETVYPQFNNQEQSYQRQQSYHTHGTTLLPKSTTYTESLYSELAHENSDNKQNYVKSPLEYLFDPTIYPSYNRVKHDYNSNLSQQEVSPYPENILALNKSSSYSPIVYSEPSSSYFKDYDQFIQPSNKRSSKHLSLFSDTLASESQTYHNTMNNTLQLSHEFDNLRKVNITADPNKDQSNKITPFHGLNIYLAPNSNIFLSREKTPSITKFEKTSTTLLQHDPPIQHLQESSLNTINKKYITDKPTNAHQYSASVSRK